MPPSPLTDPDVQISRFRFLAGETREADPIFARGRPMMPWKKQARAHGVPPGNGIQHPRKDFQR